METIETLRRFSSLYPELQKIARSLHKQDENACNYGLTPRQEKLVARLENKANELAKWFDLEAYHQSDPRGGTLYLVEPNQNNDQAYYNGVYINTK